MAVLIDTDEAVLTERDATHARAAQLGQCHHAVDVQVPIAGVDHDHAVLGHLGVGGRDRLDVRVREHLGDRVARSLAEDRKRGVLGGYECHGQLDPHVISPPGGHHRQLIQR